MSPENFNIPAKPKEETRKAGQNRSLQQQQQQDQPHINCPRCDSPNTKFCYYNNYSLTQPRHFCKTCRRYWTKGGALRNVPIGGGCRKTKKANTSSSSSTSRLSVFGEHFSSGESSDQIGLKFFHGGNNNNSNISPAMDFQLGSSSLSLIPRSQYPSQNSIYTQFSISPNTTNSSVGASTIDPIRTSLLGLNFPLKSQCEIGIGGGGGGSGSDSIHQSMNVHTNLASSIESLSCMNQDLHWKLQQQRLAMLFGGGSGSGSVGGGLDHVDDHDQSKKGANFLEIQSQKLQPILFQNLEISKKDGSSGGGGSGDMATEWFFDGSYNNAPIISSGGPRNLVHDQSQQKYDGANGNDEDHNSTTWNNGIQAWNDLHQFSSNLP